MNLTEEKKGPLRLVPNEQKKLMLKNFFQKGTKRVAFHSFNILPNLSYLSSLFDQ